jgi:hypothetical protein
MVGLRPGSDHLGLGEVGLREEIQIPKKLLHRYSRGLASGWSRPYP